MRWIFGERKGVGRNPDWEHNVLCNSSLFRHIPVAALDKKAYTEGD
jgi:hypothetical protein